MKNKKLLLTIICAVSLQCTGGVFAEPAPMIPAAIQSTGGINTHDMDILKQQQIEQIERKDFQNLEKSNKFKDKEKKQTRKEKKQKEKVIKAKAVEYATKGVYIENIQVSPSEILTTEEISDIIEPHTGQNLTFDAIKQIVDEINNLYLEKGYVTARAYVPEQTIDNETLYIELVEGKVGNVTVTNNRWTRDSYIKNRIQGKKGDVFDIVELEEDVLNFNRYTTGVELSANLKPGEETLGTTDIELNAREKIPFHITGIFDNAGRDTIGKLRGGVMLQHDSLFGFRDKLTAGMYASRHSITPFADYNIPVNKYDGRVGFMFSSSNAAIRNGSYSMFNIKSRSYVYSLYFNQPIVRKPYMELSSYSALNYKQATTTFDGYDLYTDKITSAQTGLNFRYDTRKGIWYLNQNVYYAFPIFKDNSNYLKLEGGLVRLHDFGHGIVGQFRANYQWIPQDIVPYIDQYQGGGLSSVRGYSEGLLIGKTGYFVSTELLFPFMPSKIKTKKKEVPFLGKYVKGVVFVDHAGVLPFKGEGPGKDLSYANDFLLSAGLGLRITLPGDLTARLYWGFPMIRNSHEYKHPSSRFHFEMMLTPDFDALVKMRHPKEPKENKKEIKTL